MGWRVSIKAQDTGYQTSNFKWFIIVHAHLPSFCVTIFFTLQFKVVSNRLPLFSLTLQLSPTNTFTLFLEVWYFWILSCWSSSPKQAVAVFTSATVISHQYFYPLLRGLIFLDPILLIRSLLCFCMKSPHFLSINSSELILFLIQKDVKLGF